jgi:Fe-S-cluster containining protein
MTSKNLLYHNDFPYFFKSNACTKCRGKCCRGRQGYVWLTVEELRGMAEAREISPDAFARQYVRRIDGRLSLKELRINNEHLCCFLDPVDHRCTIYDQRPEQCRTFPFWEDLKEDQETLVLFCPGVSLRRADINTTPEKVHIMGDTFGNSSFNSNGGTQNIAQGTGAVAQQNNNFAAQQVSTDELLKLLAEIKERLPELPEEVRDEVQHEVDGAQLYAKKAKPDAAMITARLTAAQKILAAIPATVAAAKPVGELLGRALVWCGKAMGM